MPNATPNPPFSDEGDVFRLNRPEDLSDEKWAEIKAAALGFMTYRVGQITGVCQERPWCHGVAGLPDHRDYHASNPIDLVPPIAGEKAGPVAAWLVENRGDGRGVRLVIDGSGRFAGRPAGCELDARDAALLLCATTEGASLDNDKDARMRLLDLLGQVDELRDDLDGGWRPANQWERAQRLADSEGQS